MLVLVEILLLQQQIIQDHGGAAGTDNTGAGARAWSQGVSDGGAPGMKSSVVDPDPQQKDPHKI